MIAELCGVGGSQAWGMKEEGSTSVETAMKCRLWVAGKLKHLAVGGALAALARSTLARGYRG
ncbi:hypothetical protein D3C85_1674010 [compost metagenome]